MITTDTDTDTDSGDVLAELRTMAPDPQALETAFPTSERDELAASILATDRRPRRGDLRVAVGRAIRRRRVAIAVAVVGAAAAAVVIPAVLPNGSPGGASPAAATALHRLSRVAAAGPTDHVGPGQLRHMIVRERQSGDNGEGPRGVLTTTMESWTDAAGRVWRKDIASGDGVVRRQTDYYLFPAGDDDTSAPSPSYLASLPTEPDALLSYLRKHVSGSTSTDEAVFTAVGDMLRGGFAPAKLRSAAIEVLAMTGHVRLGPDKHDALARPAEQFEFVDGKHRPGELQALYFDPQTAQIIEERDTSADVDFVSLLLKANVVDSVPAAIRGKAQLQN